MGGAPPPCSGRSASAFAPTPLLPKRKTPRGEVLQPRRPLPGDPRGGGATGSPGAGARGFCTVRRKPSAPQHPPRHPDTRGGQEDVKRRCSPAARGRIRPGLRGELAAFSHRQTWRAGGGGSIRGGGTHPGRCLRAEEGGEVLSCAPPPLPQALGPFLVRAGEEAAGGAAASLLGGQFLGCGPPPHPPRPPPGPAAVQGGSPGGALRSYRGKAHASLALVAHAGRAGASHIPWVRAPR